MKLSDYLAECADCGSSGVRCATPAGEVQMPDLSLVSVADEADELGIEILAASAHGIGDSVCGACETVRAKAVGS